MDMTHVVGKLLRGKRDDQGRLDYEPEVVAQNCDLGPDALTAFCHQNLSTYYGDLYDLAKVLDALSEVDCLFG